MAQGARKEASFAVRVEELPVLKEPASGGYAVRGRWGAEIIAPRSRLRERPLDAPGRIEGGVIADAGDVAGLAARTAS